MSSNPNASYASQLAKGHHAKRVYQSQPTSYSTASCPCPSSYPYGPYSYTYGVTTCFNSSNAAYCMRNNDCYMSTPCQPA
jgi:hypothetical protein